MFEIETLHQRVEQICYAFYRYEIKSGLAHLDSAISEFSQFLTKQDVSEEQLQEMNQLLEIIVLAVEKRDFLIAADLLKYELFERITQAANSSP